MIRFNRYYVANTENGEKARCWYHVNERGVGVYAKEYGHELSRVFDKAGLPIKNDTDSMSDYFDKDSVLIPPGHPLYDGALIRANANKEPRAPRKVKADAARLPPGFESALDEFLGAAAAKIDPGAGLGCDNGLKYVRVIRSDKYGGRSVHCFVDKSNGDVKGSDGWKRPVSSGPRVKVGNIFEPDHGARLLGPYGI